MSEPAHMLEAKRIYEILKTKSPLITTPEDVEKTEDKEALFKMDMRSAYETLCDEIGKAANQIKTDLDGYFLSVWETLEDKDQKGLLVVLSNQPPGDLPIPTVALDDEGNPKTDDNGKYIFDADTVIPGDIQPKRAVIRTDLYQMDAPRVCPFWFGELGLVVMLDPKEKEEDGSPKKVFGYFVYMLYSAGAAEADMEGIRTAHSIPGKTQTEAARTAIDIRMFEQQQAITELSLGQADFYKKKDHQFNAAVEDERKTVQAEYLRRAKRRGEAEQKSLADRTLAWLEKNLKWLVLLAIVVIVVAAVIYIVNTLYGGAPTGGGTPGPYTPEVIDFVRTRIHH